MVLGYIQETVSGLNFDNNIAILVKVTIHHEQLSKALYQTAAEFLKKEFGSESDALYDESLCVICNTIIKIC